MGKAPTALLLLLCGVLCNAGCMAELIEHYDRPMYGVYRLDYCLNFAADCGRDAADAFCQWRGHMRAHKFARDDDVGSLTPTFVAGAASVCQPACNGFRYIDCVSAGPGDASHWVPPHRKTDYC